MDRTYLDWPFFEKRHGELEARLSAWCRENVPDEIDESPDLREACRALARLLGEGGWLKYLVTRQYGGVHEVLDLRSICLIRSTLARHSGLADFVFAMQGLGSCAISMYGSAPQKEKYLAAVASGERIAAFAMTEESSGSDVANLQTTAADRGDHFLLNGAKTFISNAGLADHYIVFARTGEGGPRGISAFIVEAGSPGLDDSQDIPTISPHPLGKLQFTDCAVPQGNLLGESGVGFKQGMVVLDFFRSTVGAAALGFARRALDEATRRAMGRWLFDSRLSDNPITQSRLAEMALDIDASALLIYRAAWVYDVERRKGTREASMAKLFATERAQRVIDKALQLFGGLGVVRGVPVESLYREVRALRIYEGASEVQKLVIARQHLNAYRDDESQDSLHSTKPASRKGGVQQSD